MNIFTKESPKARTFIKYNILNLYIYLVPNCKNIKEFLLIHIINSGLILMLFFMLLVMPKFLCNEWHLFNLSVYAQLRLYLLSRLLTRWTSLVFLIILGIIERIYLYWLLDSCTSNYFNLLSYRFMRSFFSPNFDKVYSFIVNLDNF